MRTEKQTAILHPHIHQPSHGQRQATLQLCTFSKPLRSESAASHINKDNTPCPKDFCEF